MPNVTSVRTQLNQWATAHQVNDLKKLAPDQLKQASEELGIPAGELMASLDESSFTPAVTKGTKLSLEDAADAYAVMTEGLVESGRGDADAFKKFVVDIASTANGLGRALEQIAAKAADPMTRQALANAAGELTKLSAKGEGDKEYWVNRTWEAAAQVRSSLAEFHRIADAPPDELGVVELSEMLHQLAEVARCIIANIGPGNIFYFQNTVRDYDLMTEAIGHAIEVISSRIGDAAKQTILSQVASDFRDISCIGEGKVQYWCDKEFALRQRITQLADQLDKLAEAAK